MLFNDVHIVFILHCSFTSCLLTAVLTHHLSWTQTVAPVDNELSATCLDKSNAQWLNIFGRTHPYNPLWAQLGDLYGAIGFPRRLTRTVIVGLNADLVRQLLNILSYFIRCAEIVENAEDCPRLMSPSSPTDSVVMVQHSDAPPVPAPRTHMFFRQVSEDTWNGIEYETGMAPPCKLSALHPVYDVTREVDRAVGRQAAIIDDLSDCLPNELHDSPSKVGRVTAVESEFNNEPVKLSEDDGESADGATMMLSGVSHVTAEPSVIDSTVTTKPSDSHLKTVAARPSNLPLKTSTGKAVTPIPAPRPSLVRRGTSMFDEYFDTNSTACLPSLDDKGRPMYDALSLDDVVMNEPCPDVSHIVITSSSLTSTLTSAATSTLTPVATPTLISAATSTVTLAATSALTPVATLTLISSTTSTATLASTSSGNSVSLLSTQLQEDDCHSLNLRQLQKREEKNKNCEDNERLNDVRSVCYYN